MGQRSNGDEFERGREYQRQLQSVGEIRNEITETTTSTETAPQLPSIQPPPQQSLRLLIHPILQPLLQPTLQLTLQPSLQLTLQPPPHLVLQPPLRSPSPAQPQLRLPLQPPLRLPLQPPLRSPSQPPLQSPSQPPQQSPSQPQLRSPSQPQLRSPSQPQLRSPTQTLQPPTHQTLQPPTHETLRPPTPETLRPPTHETLRPPTHETLTLPICEIQLARRVQQALTHRTLQSPTHVTLQLVTHQTLQPLTHQTLQLLTHQTLQALTHQILQALTPHTLQPLAQQTLQPLTQQTWQARTHQILQALTSHQILQSPTHPTLQPPTYPRNISTDYEIARLVSTGAELPLYVTGFATFLSLLKDILATVEEGSQGSFNDLGTSTTLIPHTLVVRVTRHFSEHIRLWRETTSPQASSESYLGNIASILTSVEQMIAVMRNTDETIIYRCIEILQSALRNAVIYELSPNELLTINEFVVILRAVYENTLEEPINAPTVSEYDASNSQSSTQSSNSEPFTLPAGLRNIINYREEVMVSRFTDSEDEGDSFVICAGESSDDTHSETSATGFNPPSSSNVCERSITPPSISSINTVPVYDEISLAVESQINISPPGSRDIPTFQYSSDTGSGGSSEATDES